MHNPRITDSIGSVSLRLPRSDFNIDVEFEIPAKGVVGIFGVSGSGKTSLLRCLAGLEQNAKGRITVGDESWQDSGNRVFVPPHLRGIGYVFQDGRLFPHLTVESNLLFGRKRRGDNGISLDEICSLLGISHLLARKPAQLSGGEQQRVAIGRALLSAPKVLLLDEPLANLDRERKQEILPYLEKLSSRIDIPVFFVSHSLDEVTRLCDQLITLRDGRILAKGMLEDVLLNPAVENWLDDMACAVIYGEFADVDPVHGLLNFNIGELTMRLPGHSKPADGLSRLRILANDVSLLRDPPKETTILNTLPVTVMALTDAERDRVFVSLDLAGQTLLCRISRASAAQISLKPGDRLFAQIKGAAIRR